MRCSVVVLCTYNNGYEVTYQQVSNGKGDNVLGYDCSITKRKGCNYCCHAKEIPFTKGQHKWWIDDETKELLQDTDHDIAEIIKINYCPICGKELS